MHENNTILNFLSILMLIGLVLIAVWGTTFAAQAITGKHPKVAWNYRPIKLCHNNIVNFHIL